ncbi:hypothetical protein EJ08DRAFT_489172 [Tothia fuscella]|uniref:Uncharacterized protein n=1 Tax=Tothia fuscella TaxID=1048955 RepID=A0A9P4NHC7_9PEZI|nr:hypothetical protein EJ08DRAFT_489172 [Tothia fuscella]
MEVPLGSERFTFPNARPSSPPATPESSSRSRNISSTSSFGIQENKRYGFINFGLSPPENLAPRGPDHHFSYTPPDREDESSDSSDSDSDSNDVGPPSSAGDGEDDEGNHGDEEDGEEEDSSSEAESRGDASELRRPSFDRRFNEETDVTLEEVSENDMEHDDAEIIRPDETEDADSEIEVPEPESKDLLDALKNLQCDPEAQEKAHEFEEAQLKKYRRKKKRWSMGGLKKRSHAESVGSSSSDNADIELIEDFHQLGSSARRLRRRTQGPVDAERPRTSLLFEAPPRELEELGFISGLDQAPPLVSDSEDDSSSADEDDDEEILVVEEHVVDEDMLVPAWLMQVDSDISRPTTAIDPEMSRPTTVI